MQQYTENSPHNARVKIDYTHGEARVGFDYPLKYEGFWNRVEHGTGMATFIGWWILLLLIGSAISLLLLLGWNPWLALPIWFGVFFGIPLAIACIVAWKYQYFAGIWPKLNAWYHDKYRAVVTELDEPVYEIPLFQNVFLEYEATEEFSKYLETVNIVEHPFELIRDNGEIIPNTYLWKAVFKFRRIPRIGKLEVRFK